MEKEMSIEKLQKIGAQARMIACEACTCEALVKHEKEEAEARIEALRQLVAELNKELSNE